MFPECILKIMFKSQGMFKKIFFQFCYINDWNVIGHSFQFILESQQCFTNPELIFTQM